MKKALFTILFFITLLNINAQIKFEDYFLNESLRIDYLHIGDAKTEIITIDRLYRQNIWAGSLTNLLDEFNNGRYYIKIYDEKSGSLIYSKGFDSYFGEYQTGADGVAGIKRTFQETSIIPFPKNKVVFAVEKRNLQKELHEIYRTNLDPNNVMIIKDKPDTENTYVVKSLYNGNPHNKVDVVIAAEGYAANEKAKFEKDLKRYTELMFTLEPYKSNKHKFNVYGVFKPSVDSGVDEPRADIFTNTTLDATFNSMGSERYLLTEKIFDLQDMIAGVPCDAIYVMCNHKRYGGGGIYNFYCTFTTDNQFGDYLFLHEFGHSFAGLADEYYTSSTAYNEFYPKGVEPVEPNITALLDPANLKWNDMVDASTELPTKWEKADFDKMDNAWQKERRDLNNYTAKLKREKASEELIKKAEQNYATKDKAHSDKVDQYLQSSKYWGKVGAFEGAGYASKDLYRSMLDCIMFSKGNKPFCKVCTKAIERVINHYAE